MLAADTTIDIALAVAVEAAEIEVAPDLQHPRASSPTGFGIVIARLASRPSTSR